MSRIGINELLVMSDGADTRFRVYTGENEVQDRVEWVNPSDMTMNVFLEDEEGKLRLTEQGDEFASEILFVDYMRIVGEQTGATYIEKSA